MFKYSTQLDDINNSLTKDEEQIDTEEMIQRVLNLVERYSLVAQRWSIPDKYTTIEVRKCMLRKTPRALRMKLLDYDMHDLGIDQFIELVRRVNQSLQAQLELQKGISGTDTLPEVFVANVPQPAQMTNKGPTCYN